MVISNTIQFIAFNVGGGCCALAGNNGLKARVLVMEDHEEYSSHFTPTWKERLIPRNGGDWLIALIVTLCLLSALGYAAWTILFPPHSTPPRPPQSQAQSAMPDTEAQSQSPSTRDSESQVMMSGRYEITADGKLLRPKDSPTPVLPRPGENMRFDSAEGMADFARYVVELTLYVWLSNDTQPFEPISTPECVFCQTLRTSVAQFKDEGGWVESGTLEIVSATDPEPVPERAGHWITLLEVHKSEMPSYSGEKLVLEKPQDLRMIIEGYKTPTGWKLEGISIREFEK